MLHDTNIYVNEDFSEETRRQRSELQIEAKKCHSEGKFDRVVYNHLVLHGRKDGSTPGA